MTNTLRVNKLCTHGENLKLMEYRYMYISHVDKKHYFLVDIVDKAGHKEERSLIAVEFSVPKYL